MIMTVRLVFNVEDIAVYKAVAFIYVATFTATKTCDTMTKWTSNGADRDRSNCILDVGEVMLKHFMPWVQISIIFRRLKEIYN